MLGTTTAVQSERLVLSRERLSTLDIPSFGFCGTGEGFCTPSNRGTNNPDSRTRTRTRSGAGCVLNDAEWVGGDLPAILGGGGVELDRDTADECFNRCEENPRCTWYTYDER